jgi:hypothetical protein
MSAVQVFGCLWGIRVVMMMMMMVMMIKLSVSQRCFD